MIDNVRDIKVMVTVEDMFHGCLKIARNHVKNVQMASLLKVILDIFRIMKYYYPHELYSILYLLCLQ